MNDPADVDLEITQSMIAVKGLRFAWSPGDRPVLDIDDFEVRPRERIFLRGASGSGKTTLLSILGGVVMPDAGSVRVADTELSSLKNVERDRFRACNIGFIFQMFNLVPYLSLTKNVALPCWFSEERRARATRERSLDEESVRLLNQLGLDETLVDRSASALSVGQQQRVAAARALMGSPPIVIADEPTSALDADARESFIDLLFEECEKAGATILFVSHDQSLAPMFDRSVDLSLINAVSDER